MSLKRYRNISQATYGSLQDLLSGGEQVETRGSCVTELRNRVTVLERPEERCLFVPRRGNDIVASITETLWVLAGRDDIEWLGRYLPRAADFSDNGTTWRAAYGPRLRNWHGIDQIAQVLQLIRDEKSTRRAAMSLFDPARDYAESKDIPCTNWLHWLCRDERLHLVVGIRSNDAVWGFSGVNSFEWSVLQSYLALWTELDVGDVTYLAPSFHLYDRHLDRARKIVSSFRGTTSYQYGLFSPPVTTSFSDFGEALDEWFSLEKTIREDPNASTADPADPFLAAALGLVRAYWGKEHGWSDQRMADHLLEMAESDLAAAGWEHFSRNCEPLLEHLTDGPVASFLQAYRGQVAPTLDLSQVVDAIIRLHTGKDGIYGISWKKRGEMTSILANVARKVDRLAEFGRNGLELSDESAFDTAVDLFVYAQKYRLYLIEQLPVAHRPELHGLARSALPPSENIEAFNLLTEGYKRPPQTEARDSTDLIAVIEDTFDSIHAHAQDGGAPSERLAWVASLADDAFELVLQLEGDRPGLVGSLISS